MGGCKIHQHRINNGKHVLSAQNNGKHATLRVYTRHPAHVEDPIGVLSRATFWSSAGRGRGSEREGDRVVTGHHFKNLRKTPTRTATDGAYFAPESTPSAPRALIAAAKCHMMYSARSAVSVTSAEGSNLNHRNLKKVSNPS